MLECHDCLRRCLRALLSTTQRNSTSPLPLPISNARLFARGFQTASETPVPPSEDQDASSSASSKWGPNIRRPIVRLPVHEGQPATETWADAVGRPHRALQKSYDQARRQSPVQGKSSGRPLKESHLRTELKYLKDPVKLAEHVAHVLKSNDEEKALALCRMSSKALANTVSWNYLMDWQMQNGKTNAALSTFNEMKKRAQKPDSYTYVLLLRGLAHYAHHPHSLGKALSLYHSMKGPDSHVQPNIIHVNAVLKVCARANDMDSLWDIASKLPERGPQSANSWTFTTILNYMRMNVLSEIQEDPGSETSLRRIEEVVIKGKQLWSVIVARWQEGELMIDEDLVCSMGRLLLTGSRPRDWDNVLSLVQQTMNITRLEARLGTVARASSGAPEIRAPHTPGDLKDDPNEITLNIGEESAESVFDPLAIKPVSNDRTKHYITKSNCGRSLFAFAQPGNKTLSLILESCQKTILKYAAKGYWDLLTDPSGYGIKPDPNNVHMMLRNLRRAGASTEAMLLVEDLPRLNVPPTGTTFWLAMTTCQRDAENPNVMDNARRVLDYMQRTLSIPNIMTISIYLELARQTNQPTNVIAALQRIWPSVVNLKSLLNYGGVNIPETAQPRVSQQTYRIEALRLFKAIVQCYDYVLSPSRNVDLGTLRETYLERRWALKAYIDRNHFVPRTSNVVLQDGATKPAQAVPIRSGQGVEADT